MARRQPAWKSVLSILAWVLLLALLPWWLGLPLLLALVAAGVLLQHRLTPRHVEIIRHALRWGLAAWLLGLLCTLGAGVAGWGAVLLGALAGYTLLAGLDAWLKRGQPRGAATAGAAEWPELARAPIGPPAEIIELQDPAWQAVGDELRDPRGGQVAASNALTEFAQACFSPEGRWLAARTADRRVLALWDRQHDRRYRLRGWRLSGWYREQPWMSRRDDDMPLALHAVLGHDDDD
jgi:hypothetical protein